MRLCFRACLRMASVLLLLFSPLGFADLLKGEDGEVVADLSELGVTPYLLSESILGPGVEIRSVEFTGGINQAGYVSGYGLLGFPDGVVLSNGDVLKILGPNEDDTRSTIIFDWNFEDEDFFKLNDGYFTRDAAILEIDFVAPESQSQLVIEYVFGSDEYSSDTSSLANERHDFVAIFVNGVNCATVPDGINGDNKVGVSSINNEMNSDLYIDNVRSKSGFFSQFSSPFNTEMDGFTQVLTCVAPIVSGEVNHLEFGIVDASSGLIKGSVDSWFILKALYTERLLDADGDGIPNHLDSDDDGDGIPDDIEGNYDVDGDGLPNSLDTDSDGDDEGDIAECPDASDCPDSDGDGIPDFVDIADFGSGAGDSDNDGISDDIECSTPSNNGRDCLDSDSDLIPDYSDTDSDNDGLSDKEECADTGSGCIDSDGDGLPDYLDVEDNSADDADSDGDGTSDQDECLNDIENCPDSDGDGIKDHLDAVNGSASDDNDGDGVTNGDECLEQRFCPDSDGDGLADFMDADTPVVDIEDDTATDPRAVGDTSGTTDQRVVVGINGIGSFNPLLLGLLSFLFALRGLKKIRQGFLSSTTLGVLFFGLFALSHDKPAVAGDSSEQDIFEGFYMGLSIGQSSLEPDTSSSPYTLDEDGGLGFKVAAGYDLTQRFSVEGALAVLGEAELSPSGSLEYQPLYVSGVYHLLGKRSRSVFLRAGLATLNISSDIPVNEKNDYQLMLGLGAEWAFRKGWSARAEIESFDEDANLVSVGIVKRFARKRLDIAVLDTEPGLMGTGVVSEFDTTEEEICSDIAMESGCFIPTIEEQEDSCAVVAGRIEGIHFELNKADLTPSAIAVLDEAASVLKTCPSFKVEIQAYADNVGSKERNLVLSRHRAHTVQLHLAARGIALSRLLSRGFGESNPVADNATKEGRALNRRVEFKLMEINAPELISSDE